MDTILGSLTPEQYWEWRFKIAEMQLAERATKIVEAQHALLQKDMEILRLNTSLFRRNIDAAEATQLANKNAYQAHRTDLEEKLGFNLTDCVIDEVTYEVRKLGS